MADKTLKTRFLVRRGTYNEIKDIVLADGEPGYDTTNDAFAIGDGEHKFSELTTHVPKAKWAENADKLDNHDSTYFLNNTQGYATQSWVTNSAKAHDANLLDGHDSSYFVAQSSGVKYGDALLTTNPFGGKHLYISKIDNAFYAADKRWNVTVTDNTTNNNFSSDSVARLFNGNYEDNLIISAGHSATIKMIFGGPGYHFPDYPYGYIYVSFYYTSIPHTDNGIKARMYCNFANHGIGWHDLKVDKLADGKTTNVIYRIREPFYNMEQLEITVQAPLEHEAKITQVELNLDRPNSSRTPFLSKYAAETLYYELNAPSFAEAGVSLVKKYLGINATANAAKTITETLPIIKGGTGGTTADQAMNNLANGVGSWSSYDPVDGERIIATNGSAAGTYTLLNLWEKYYKKKTDAFYLPFTGGQMTGPITIAGGDGKGILFKDKTSNINIVDGNTRTLVGFLNGNFTLGHFAYNMNIRGYKLDIYSAGNAGLYLKGVSTTTDYAKLGTQEADRVFFIQPGDKGTVTIGGDTSNTSIQGDKSAKLIVHGNIKENNKLLSDTYLGIDNQAKSAQLADEATKTTGTLTFTGASTETFNGNNSPVVHIPNDAITLSTDPTAKGQILRSMTIGGTTWIIAGTDNNIGVTYEEIKEI